MKDRERIEALERCVRLLAEAMRDALEAMAEHDHGDSCIPRSRARTALHSALGRLDAVLSGLGVGAPGGAREGVGE